MHLLLAVSPVCLTQLHLFVLAQLRLVFVCSCPVALESCLFLPSCIWILFVLAQMCLNLVCPCPDAFESSASQTFILCMLGVLPLRQLCALLATCLPSAWHSVCAYASLAGSFACKIARKQMLPTDVSSYCSLYIQPETRAGDHTQAWCACRQQPLTMLRGSC